MKDCPTCNLPRDLIDFAPNPSRSDGLHGECRPCHNARQREHKRRNRAAQTEYQRQYRARKREEKAS